MWDEDLKVAILNEFVEAARMRGTHLVSRDERPGPVKLDPFIPAPAPEGDVVVVEAGEEDQPEDPPAPPRRRVVVDVAPERKAAPKRVNEPWWWKGRSR